MITLVGAVEGLINLNPLATVNLSEVYEQLALLNNLSTLTSAEVELQLQMQGDDNITRARRCLGNRDTRKFK